MSEKDNIRLVWHCSNRGNECLKYFHVCKGTRCSKYTPEHGSYHSYYENDPIVGYIGNDGKIINGKDPSKRRRSMF